MNRRRAYLLVFLLLVAVPLAGIGYKLFVLNYPLGDLVPAMSYQVDVSMRVDGHGEDIDLSTYLPRSDQRQTITEESNISGRFAFSVQSDNDNRFASWKGDGITGQHNIVYSYAVQAHHYRFEIPPGLPIPTEYSADLQDYLKPEPGIQVDDPLIAEMNRRLFPEGRPDTLTALTRIHRHLQDNFENRNFSGYTDALTALKLGEASCNGKSRLFVALARNLNLPARLVGGLVMEQGVKRVSHQWVEVYVNGHWVPFDTINDRFAEIPSHYLTLYYGDRVLFKHTANINFQYFFKINKRLVPNRSITTPGDSAFNALNLYALFERIGISQNLLKIIIMLPLGALVTVIFRNVIGVETFGTFLPALIAAAARETGLFWGIIGFTLIILISAMLRKGLDWMQLLHSPKMAVMFTMVVIVMLTMTGLAVNYGLFEFAHITLFPIAILAITAERFALIETEQGFRKALRITGVTLLVTAACYAVMDSLFMQSLILAFPEMLLVVIALNLWLGKWMGMRLLEFIRFRRLIFRG
ncbi:MAG TPA: UUP1 family membrane protein [Gammaproteobacteria bacterium]